ncbi:MAG: hypothetical protein ABL925_01570 [Methylococcales bacterium]
MRVKKLNLKPNPGRRLRVARLTLACLFVYATVFGNNALAEQAGSQRSWLDKLNISGSFDYETYQYPTTDMFPGQVSQNHALRLQFRQETDLGNRWRAGFKPFIRYDFNDQGQNTLRLDEGWLEYAGENWDVRVGNQIFSWGQMESVSRIDVLNPKDFRDDIVDSAKVGVPSVRLRWMFENSDLSFYALPYYMPSKFPQRYNFYSISSGWPIDNADDTFEAQGAVRYFHAGDGYDFALSYTNLIEPTPIYQFTRAGRVVATPYRSQRFGIEATKVLGSLLLKAEGFYRIPQTDFLENIFLYTLGAEYTIPSIIGLSDLTLFAEYFGQIGSRGQVPFQALEDSLFTGLRWTANDQSRQQVEVGAVNNFNHVGTYLMRASYQRNLTDSLQLHISYTDSFGFFANPTIDEDRDGAFRVRLRYSF